MCRVRLDSTFTCYVDNPFIERFDLPSLIRILQDYQKSR